MPVIHGCAVYTGMYVVVVQVAVGRRSVVKLRVNNTGQRAAFVKVLSSAGAHKCVCMCVCECVNFFFVCIPQSVVQSHFYL